MYVKMIRKTCQTVTYINIYPNTELIYSKFELEIFVHQR